LSSLELQRTDAQVSDSVQVRKYKFPNRAVLIPIALIAVAVVLWMGAATLITYRILHPPFLDGGFGNVIFGSEKVRAAAQLGVDPKSCCDAGFEDLRITDKSGVSVAAWFVPGKLRATVLLIPASGASRRSMLTYLKFLHAVGVTVLMIDSSDFERGRAGWGWNERGIVRAAVAAINAKGYHNIAALGVSEGAAAALMVQGETRDLFKVIIADSSFTSLGAMLRRSPSLEGLNPAFLRTVMWEVGWRLGRNPDDISAEYAARRIGRCALLIIQNANDPLTGAAEAQKLYAARTYPANRGMYVPPSMGHGDSIYIDPETYEHIVLEFLVHNLPKAVDIMLAPR
jgi:pimeloyl-ACP methyl ester carboxylesterase